MFSCLAPLSELGQCSAKMIQGVRFAIGMAHSASQRKGFGMNLEGFAMIAKTGVNLSDIVQRDRGCMPIVQLTRDLKRLLIERERAPEVGQLIVNPRNIV